MTRSSKRLDRRLVPDRLDIDTAETDPSFEAFDTAKMSQDNVPSLEEALHNCFETGEYADMTITCGSRIWRVHKVVVCRVPFFAKAVAGKFKEARDSCIDLVDDDPSAVEHMLRWLYNDSYDDEDFKQRDICELQFLARCYKFADKYLLAEVRTWAGHQLRAILIDCKWDAKDLLALVEELFAGADESSKAAPELLRTCEKRTSVMSAQLASKARTKMRRD
ncbi:hypothetical protein KC318_g15442 [Hortaea werneckii]|nr:hypothetical protein KC334_g15573 [Hortaea werneckii]KAI7019414.1 hypothetical protein KC355_g3059 [Hortaea werneckii]KAI7651782.1 hypothetical protein KC318_g15442 [Hortaea werneckii]